METLEQYPSRAAEIPIFDREMQSEDTCNAAILVVIKASDALRADLESFSEHRPYPESKSHPVKQFLVAASHRLHILLEPALEALRSSLTDKVWLEKANETIRKANTLLSPLMLAGKVQTVVPGDEVPTSSTRELMYRLILSDDAFLKPMMESAEKAREAMKNILNKLYQTQSKPGEYTTEQMALLVKVNDGVPAMFFVCRHESPSTLITEFHFGASQEEWEGLIAVEELRRRDRDHKVSTYIECAQKAFIMLRETEVAELAKTDPELDPKERKAISRKEAIIATRSHPDFLGRTTEVGQAFSKDLHLQQCCFVCQGMMGYQVAAAAKWKKKQVASYQCHFDWLKRAGYAHSCAEIAVSQLCAGNHLSEGREFNY